MTAEEEEHPLHSAVRRMSEDNLYPYARVAAALERHEQRARAEQAWWNQFLPGNAGEAATREIEAPGPRQLTTMWAPDVGGALAGGEIVRTWIPPVDDVGGVYDQALIIGQETFDRRYALHLSSSSHRGAHRYFAIGAGPKNDYGRFSWVDVDRLFSVDVDGVRRSGFAIDRPHFLRVADELYRRYTWPMAD